LQFIFALSCSEPISFGAFFSPFYRKQIGVACLLVLLMLVLAIGAIHHWASNNFYLTRIQMLFVCFLAFLLALAAFLVGLFEGEKQNPLPSYVIFHAPYLHSSLAKIVPVLLMTLTFSHICCSDKPFVGASVGYFSFLFLLAGRALTVSYITLFSFKLHIFLFVFGLSYFWLFYLIFVYIIV
jgi:hypothetical protein